MAHVIQTIPLNLMEKKKKREWNKTTKVFTITI